VVGAVVLVVVLDMGVGICAFRPSGAAL
jgi:hypothetical protein